MPSMTAGITLTHCKPILCFTFAIIMLLICENIYKAFHISLILCCASVTLNFEIFWMIIYDLIFFPLTQKPLYFVISALRVLALNRARLHITVYSQNLTSVMENMLVHLHTCHICIYVYLEEHFKTLLGIFFTFYLLQDLFPSDVSIEKYQCTGLKQLCLQSS